jgi:hypothetical protein
MTCPLNQPTCADKIAALQGPLTLEVERFRMARSELQELVPKPGGLLQTPSCRRARSGLTQREKTRISCGRKARRHFQSPTILFPH